MPTTPPDTAQSILTRWEVQRDLPLRAMLEISDRCNEVCVHCYQEQGLKGEMSTPEIKRVLDELAAIGILVLTISGGEPTLRHDFVELVAYARQLGFAVRIFTNGLNMTRELAGTLGDHAVQGVELSLYSHRAEVHDFVTGVPGSFARTVDAVRFLVEAGVDVCVKSPVMSLNENELDAYRALVEGLGARVLIDPTTLLPRESGDAHPQMFSRTDDAFQALLRDPRLAGKPRAPRPKPLDAAICGAGRSIHIEPNGELRPCTMLEVSLGHALRDTVSGARANNAELGQLLRLTWKHIHGCRDCDLRSYCQRCFASALAEVGDALAPYPSACAAALSTYSVIHEVCPDVRTLPGTATIVGPFRVVTPTAIESVEDCCTEADLTLAKNLGWTRRAPLAAVRSAGPGDLIQIRRPGRHRATPERVPRHLDRDVGAARQTANSDGGSG